MPIILYYQYLNFSKYILHIILTVFILLFIFFKFVGRRIIVFINTTRINVNDNNSNNNNNNDNNNNNTNGRMGKEY